MEILYTDQENGYNNGQIEAKKKNPTNDARQHRAENYQYRQEKNENKSGRGNHSNIGQRRRPEQHREQQQQYREQQKERNSR